MRTVGQQARYTGDTKLRVFCAYVVEVGWLAAAILMPLFFNVFSARTFEPDKLMLLRVIVAIMLAASLVRWLESSPLKWSPTSLRGWVTAAPLSIPVVLLALVLLLTTFTSLTPAVSFWGSYERLQGTLTGLTYIALFFMVAHNLKSRQQLARLINALLLTSLPISLYAIFQHFGLDPLPWSQDVSQRVTGTMGNAIFLAAYLVMVMPLTAARWLEEFTRARSLAAPEKSAQSQPLAGPLSRSGRSLIALSLLLVIQLLAILFSMSRGPWLGLGLGLAVMLGLLAWRRGRRRLLFATIVGALFMVLFTIGLNVSQSPWANLKGASPYLERLGTIFDVQSGTNKVRLLLWFGDDVGKGAAGLVAADPLRLVVGYGPEAIGVAYYPYYPPSLAHYEARGKMPDRTHNHYLDTLLTTGLLGLFAYLLVIIVSLWLGIKLLRRAESVPLQLLVAGLIGGVVAHLGEVFFGFGIAATLTYFWLYLGAMVAISRVDEPLPEPETVPPHSQTRGATYALLTYLGVTAAAVPFSLNRAVVAWGVQNPFLLVLLGLGWAVFGWVLAALALGMVPRQAPLLRRSRQWSYLAVTGALVALAWALLSPMVADIHDKRGGGFASGGYQESAAEAYLDAIQWDGYQVMYLLQLGGIYAELAQRAVGRTVHRPVAEVSQLSKLGALSNLDQDTLYSAAEVAYARAQQLEPLHPDPTANLGRLHYVWGLSSTDLSTRDEHWERSSRYYERALALNPNAAHLYVDWGLVYYKWNRYQEALARYRQALSLDPQYSVIYLALGDLFTAQELWPEGEVAYRWGLSLEPGSVPLLSALGAMNFKAGRFEDALESYSQATTLAPKDPLGHLNLALIYRELGRIDEALEEAETALSLTPSGQRSTLERLVADLKGSKK